MQDLTANIKEFTITENGNVFKFYAPKLKAFKQLDVMTDIIRIIARGSASNKKEVEQVLNNLLQTGVKVEGADKKEGADKNIEVPVITLLIDAIKGALANLDSETLELLLSKLMNGLTIDIGNNKVVPATHELLDEKLESWKSLVQLTRELIRLNLGFL
jgi:hypothetical protein